MLEVSIPLESIFKGLHFGTNIKFVGCNKTEVIVFFSKTTRNSYIPSLINIAIIDCS